MRGAGYRKAIASAMAATAVALIFVGSIFRIRFLIILLAIISILLCIVYFWKRSDPSRGTKKAFWYALECSLVFFGGAAYGVMQSYRDGWHWSNVLALAFPVGLGVYSLWFALRLRRKSG